VITLMTDKQRRSVRALTKSAGIDPITTKVSPSDPFLAELAPGERVFRDSTSIVLQEERIESKPRFDRNGRGDGPRNFGDKSRRGPRKFASSNGGSSRGEGRGEGRSEGRGDSRSEGRGDSRSDSRTERPGNGGNRSAGGGKPYAGGGKPYGKSNGSAGKNRNQNRRQSQPR
jgi:hypothetical protein